MRFKAPAPVQFAINRNGEVVAYSVVKGLRPVHPGRRGDGVLRVEPFPQFPDALTSFSMTLTAPIQYGFCEGKGKASVQERRRLCPETTGASCNMIALNLSQLRVRYSVEPHGMMKAYLGE
jgi:hypothetical protein